MAASATGSVPFSTSSSAKKGSFQRGEGKTGRKKNQTTEQRQAEFVLDLKFTEMASTP